VANEVPATFVQTVIVTLSSIWGEEHEYRPTHIDLRRKRSQTPCRGRTGLATSWAALSYALTMMQDMTSPVGPEVLDRYRCPDRDGPGGQHVTPVNIASIGAILRAWVDGAETALPPGPYPWFVSFPRDEI
jgi:hypothetical protein